MTNPASGVCAANAAYGDGRKGTEISRFTVRQSRNLRLISGRVDLANTLGADGSAVCPN